MSVKKVAVAKTGKQFTEMYLYFQFTQREHEPNESPENSSYCTHRHLFAKCHAALLLTAKKISIITLNGCKNNKKRAMFKRSYSVLLKMIRNRVSGYWQEKCIFTKCLYWSQFY